MSPEVAASKVGNSMVASGLRNVTMLSNISAMETQIMMENKVQILCFSIKYLKYNYESGTE